MGSHDIEAWDHNIPVVVATPTDGTSPPEEEENIA